MPSWAYVSTPNKPIQNCQLNSPPKPRGNVGTAIINELLKHGDRFTITGISRPTSTYAPSNPKITAKTADYDSTDSLKDVFAGQDAVVNCVTGGATHYEPTKRIIDAAMAAGVPFYFANEYVGNIQTEQFKRLPESFVGSKIRIRAYLEELSKDGKIAWTALNGGPFFDMCKTPRPKLKPNPKKNQLPEKTRSN